jgi:UDP-N-acetylglucosamine kinase
MDYTGWAKRYKKRIAREFIRSIDFAPSDNPSGIFTAGLPGAGKTEFTQELIKSLETAPLRIDMDEIAGLMEGYKPEIADKFRGGASIIMSKIYDEVIKNDINLVFDGTFSSTNALRNLERAVSHNYQVKVYYIHQEPTVAWRFTKDRELVEHRAIERKGFIETYSHIKDNLEKLCKIDKNVTISLIIKDSQNKVGQRFENVDSKIFDRLPAFLTQDELEAVII